MNVSNITSTYIISHCPTWDLLFCGVNLPAYIGIRYSLIGERAASLIGQKITLRRVWKIMANKTMIAKIPRIARMLTVSPLSQYPGENIYGVLCRCTGSHKFFAPNRPSKQQIKCTLPFLVECISPQRILIGTPRMSRCLISDRPLEYTSSKMRKHMVTERVTTTIQAQNTMEHEGFWHP